ncbi:MAG: adenylate kinase family protein [Desulfurococcaceae archaeon]
MGRAVVIAGTPGTGKKTVGAVLSSKCGLPVVNLSTASLEEGLVAYYDEERETYVIDEEKVAKYVFELVQRSSKTVVILTHYPEIIPRELVAAVFILRTHPLELERRLKSRGWSSRKVNENVMAEILGIVAYNALQAFGTEIVYELDTTNSTPDQIADVICKVIEGKHVMKPGVEIDWLSQLPLEELSRFEDYEGSDK